MRQPRLAVIVLLWVSPLSALGQSDDLLQEGIELTRRFQYDEAIERFRQVLNTAEATPAQRATALERIGGIHFNQQAQDNARETFQRLLDLDPGHQLPADQYAPPLVQFFDSIRSEYRPQPERPQVTVRVSEDPGGSQVLVQADLSSPAPNIDQALVMTRWANDAEYEESQLTPEGNGFRATLPAPEGATTLEYYIELRTPSGYALVSVGSAETPRSREFASPQPSPVEEVAVQEVRRPWHRSWWFWTIVGVVVAGGVAGAVVGGLSASQEPVQGSLGAVELQ